MTRDHDRDLERWLVALIAAHSVVVGLALLLVPRFAVTFGGWPGADPIFFIRQAGVFHFVLATGYLVEHAQTRGVILLLCAKSVAVVFLLGYWIVMPVPWIVPFSGFADGAMGLAVVALRRYLKARD